MKTFFTALCMVVSLKSHPQSTYDFEDTRKKNEGFAKLPKNNIRADLSTFTLTGIDEAVGKSELKKVPFSGFGDNFMNFSGDNILASVKISPFDKSKHRLDYDDKYLIKIDRRTYYGDYGNVPKTYISNIRLLVDNDTVNIPSSAYTDLCNLNFTYTDRGALRSRNGIYKSKDGHTVYLYLFSKDGTGSYEVTWIIQDKKYLRRVLDYGFM